MKTFVALLLSAFGCLAAVPEYSVGGANFYIDSTTGWPVGTNIPASKVTSAQATNGVGSFTSDAITTYPGTNAPLNTGYYTNTTLLNQIVTVVPTNNNRYVDVLLNGAYYVSNSSPLEIHLKPGTYLQTTNCKQFRVRIW